MLALFHFGLKMFKYNRIYFVRMTVDIRELRFYNDVIKLGEIHRLDACEDGCFILYVSKEIGKKMRLPFWGELVKEKKIDSLDVESPVLFIVKIKKSQVAVVHIEYHGCKTITVYNPAKIEDALTGLASEIVSRLNL